MALAILCSGQARQHPDMFALTGDAPEAARLFMHAATLLGDRDPREIVRTDTRESLHHDRLGQILCTLQALTAAAALQHALPEAQVIAGYSVGEVAAWGVAGVLSPTDTLNLVARRAEVMDAATVPGDGLLFVRGLSHDVVDDISRRHDAAIAIINPRDAFIIGGSRVALDAVAHDAALSNATRIVVLPVEVASHTRRLVKASAEFRRHLKDVHMMVQPSAPPGLPANVRLLSGIDGAPVFDVAAGLDKLADQISQTVRWTDCLEGCLEGGATAFLELGPGAALSEMVTSAYRGVPARSLDDFKTLEGVRSWLGRNGGH